MVLFAVGLAAGVAALICLTTGVTMGTSLAELSSAGVVEAGLVGADLAAFVLAGLAATPRRWRVVGAKAVVLSATALVAGAAATAVSVGVGQVVLVWQGLPAVNLAADPHVVRLIVAAWLLSPLCVLLAVARAFVVRAPPARWRPSSA
jgi:hypothetical protein